MKKSTICLLLVIASFVIVAAGCGSEAQEPVKDQEKIGKLGEAGGKVAQSPDSAVNAEN